VPDQALFGAAIDHAIDHPVGCLILLIAADDLDAPVFLVGGEQGEVLQNIQQDFRPEHAFDRSFHALQISFFHASGFILHTAIVPRPPDIDGHPHRTIAKALAFGGKREDVGRKHLRRALLIPVMNVAGAVHPGHRRAHRRFGLTDHQRNAVYQQDNVEAPAAFLDRIHPLVGDHVIVVAQVLEVDQPHRSMFAAIAERHRLIAPQPFGEHFVGPHQPFALHRQRDRPQTIKHFIAAVGLGLDFRIQAEEGIAHH